MGSKDRIYNWLQALDADALVSLMESVTLHSGPAPDSSEAPQEGIPGESAPAQGSPNRSVEGNAMQWQDMLADCPLPFQESGHAAAAHTPARARRGNKRDVAPDDSDEDARVRGWFSSSMLISWSQNREWDIPAACPSVWPLS